MKKILEETSSTWKEAKKNMPKKEVAQELKEEFTKGNFKPSQLKRSKSADDISSNIPPIPPLPLVNDQLKEKQKEVENLRKKLETTNQKLTETTAELDASLLARVSAVKQFGLIYDKLQLVRKELDDTVEQASSEIITVDDKNNQLRTKLWTAQQQLTSLQSDLNLAQKLAEMRKYPLPEKESNWNYLQYPLYSLVIVLFTLWLTNHLRKEK